jgi:dihydrodipicolinate synthase/N-acetylneuraminate lyase
MGQLVQATAGTHLALLQGSEPIILSSLRQGAHGCVSALANIAPEWHRNLLDGWRSGRHADADLAQSRISALWQMFDLPQTRRSFSFFARALALGGRHRGWCDVAATIAPGFETDEEFDRLIEEYLRTVGLPGAPR